MSQSSNVSISSVIVLDSESEISEIIETKKPKKPSQTTLNSSMPSMSNSQESTPKKTKNLKRTYTEISNKNNNFMDTIQLTIDSVVANSTQSSPEKILDLSGNKSKSRESIYDYESSNDTEQPKIISLKRKNSKK